MARILLVVLMMFPSLAAAQDGQSVLQAVSKGFEALSENVSLAVVQIVASGYAPATDPGLPAASVGRQRSSGSGVIVDPAGYILTNAHVVSGATKIQVLLAVGSRLPFEGRSAIPPSGALEEARLIGVDLETDLAVLKIEGQGLPFLPFGDSEELRQGQLVFAFGSPLGLANTATMGVVSSPARQLQEDSPMIYVQTDASINPGNSGGPLVNTAGEIVGINTLIYSESGGAEGVGFAAPSNICRTVYEHLKAEGYVPRGEIGVSAQTITAELAASLSLPRQWGVILSDVKPGGPADIAGLKQNDIVLTMDGKPMENARQLRVNLYRRSTADIVRLGILRNGEEQQVSVVVVEPESALEKLVRRVESSRGLVERLGVLAVTLNAEVRRLLPQARRTSGVVVAALVVDGAVGNRVLRPGDVIHSVNQEPTPELRFLNQALAMLAANQPAALLVERDGEFRYVMLPAE